MFTFERRRQHRHSRLQHRRQPLSPLPLRGCTLLRLRLRQRGTLIRVGHFQYWLVMIVVYGQHHVDVHGLGMFALAGRRRMPIDEHLDGLGWAWTWATGACCPCALKAVIFLFILRRGLSSAVFCYGADKTMPICRSYPLFWEIERV